MRITLLNTNSHSGGAARACLRLTEALGRQADVRADMLVAHQNAEHPQVTAYPQSWWQRKRLFGHFVGERLAYLPYERSKAGRFDLSLANTGFDVSSHPLVQRANVLHLHWVNQGFLSIRSLRRLAALGKPLVWTLHDMWPFTGGCHYSGDCRKYQTHCHTCPLVRRPHPRDISYRLWERKATFYQQARLHVVTCSEWLGHQARQSPLLADTEITSIPNGIDTALFAPGDTAAIRQRLGLPLDKRLLLFGAMKVSDERKGYRYLKEALAIHHQRYPEQADKVELVVFGKADEAALATLPYPVHSLGLLSDQATIADAYRAVDAFVIPSLQDNLPNTVMESLACGTPVIGFRTGGIPEMVAHKVAGYLVSQRDSTGLADGIDYLLQDDDRYRTMATAARRKVEQDYSYDVVARRYLKLYDRLLHST